MTKNLGEAPLEKHVTALGMRRGRDRAATAPTLATATTKELVEESNGDMWVHKDDEVIRVHKQPRLELFTPRRVPQAPESKALAAIRITQGIFIDNGEKFKVIDAWTKRTTAHRELSRPWTGSTQFFRRIDNANND